MNETDIKKEDVSDNVKENLNIIEVMRTIEQQMKDPNVYTFKKTINWNQQNINKKNQDQEAMLKDISECLLRIESKLDDLLEK